MIVEDPGSFHDPGARVVHEGARVLRLLSADSWEDYQTLQQSCLAPDLDGGGLLVRTEVVPLPEGVDDGWVAALEHERIPVISYPFEWTFSMLRDAALLHLDVVERALESGMVTKDGSPYNTQFVGTRPMFIDLGSLERLSAGEGWYGYRQFCQLFLNPLLVSAVTGVPFQSWIRGAVRGITPSECVALLPWWKRLQPSVLPHVGVQAWADRRYARASGEIRRELKSAGLGPAVIRAQVRKLRRLINRLPSPDTASAWSGYEDRCHYPEADLSVKDQFVEMVAAERHRTQLLDLGANDGRFTKIALQHADYGVALDADAVVVDRLYQRLRDQGEQRLLPLVVDLTNPAGGMGWAGEQFRPFTDRVAPDLVLCLALVHHLAITESIPLPAVISWLAGLGAEAVVEFVAESDPMAKALISNKEGDRWPYSQACFLDALHKHFDVVRSEHLSMGTRTLYQIRPKAQRLTVSSHPPGPSD